MGEGLPVTVGLIVKLGKNVGFESFDVGIEVEVGLMVYGVGVDEKDGDFPAFDGVGASVGYDSDKDEDSA